MQLVERECMAGRVYGEYIVGRGEYSRESESIWLGECTTGRVTVYGWAGRVTVYGWAGIVYGW